MEKGRVRTIGKALLSLAIYVTCLAGCGSVEPDDNSIIGVIDEILTSVDPARIVVKDAVAIQDSVRRYEQLHVVVSNGTEIFLRLNGAMRAATLDDLAPGDSVQVWHTGIVFETLPPQVGAVRIEARKKRA